MYKSPCDVARMKKYIVAYTFIMLLATLNSVAGLHFQSAKALGEEGVITEDTVWMFKNSPYEVVANVTIAAGARLTIEPGVEVRFQTGSSLIVNGSLYAVGTSSNRISFTSNRSEPIPGDWNGIKLYGDGNSTLTISYCDVEYAVDGITISSLGKTLIENSTIINNSLSGIHVVGLANLVVRKNTLELNTNGISASGVTTSGHEIADNQFLNNENGICVQVYGDKSRISNILISNNFFKNNNNGIYFHSHGMSTTEPTKANAYISKVKIVGNFMESNEYGLCLLAQAWGEPGLLGGGAYIYNSMISSNTIFFSERAVCINSTSNWYSWISGLNISGNVIHSSENGIFMHAFRTPQPPYQDIPFDVRLENNTVSANSMGVEVLGDVTVNFTGNSVSYNSCGIQLISSVPSESVAHNNDIYRNTECGVCVVDDALISAENNYWGAPSGPYHETLNPSGEGDCVSGDEENLLLTPFLAESFGEINDAPSAVINAHVTMIPVNQTVLFDGYESTDDSSIIKYSFDFGDGTTIQVFPGSARHEYASPGVYNVSLIVVDDQGVESTNAAIETITVFLPPLVVLAFVDPLSVLAQGSVAVEVLVSDGEISVPEAFVQLSSDHGGSFEPASGFTDSTGDFESVFYAPSVSEPLNIRITVTASKENYEASSDEVLISVLTPSPDGAELDSYWIWFLAIIVVAVAAFILLRKRVKARLPLSSKSSVQSEKKRLLSVSTCFRSSWSLLKYLQCQ